MKQMIYTEDSTIGSILKNVLPPKGEVFNNVQSTLCTDMVIWQWLFTRYSITTGTHK
jgi:hypothetical protein